MAVEGKERVKRMTQTGLGGHRKGSKGSNVDVQTLVLTEGDNLYLH